MNSEIKFSFLRKIFENVFFTTYLYGLLLLYIIYSDFTSINFSLIFFQLIAYPLLGIFLARNFSSKDLKAIQKFFFAIIFAFFGGMFFDDNSDITSINIGLIFFVLVRYLTFSQFYQYCHIRKIEFNKLWILALPFLVSLYFCLNYVIDFIPDQLLILSLTIIFIDNLFLGVTYFYVGSRPVKILQFLGAFSLFTGDHIWIFNTYYGHLIGLSLPGNFLNYFAILILSLALYFQYNKERSTD